MLQAERNLSAGIPVGSMEAPSELGFIRWSILGAIGSWICWNVAMGDSRAMISMLRKTWMPACPWAPWKLLLPL
jgi:hypothetical protein